MEGIKALQKQGMHSISRRHKEEDTQETENLLGM